MCFARNYLTEKYQVMKHSTLNTQHSTLNTQHSTLNTQHSTLNTLISYLKLQNVLSSLIYVNLFFLLSCGNEFNDTNSSRLDPVPGNSCFQEVVSIECDIESDTFVIDSLPGFIDCEISLILEYCIKMESGAILIAASDFQIISTCEEIQDSLIYLTERGTDGELTQFISSLDYLIYEQLVIELFSIHGLNSPCNNPLNFSFTTTFNRPSCFAYCVFSSDVPTGDGGEGRFDGEGPTLFWSKSQCDSNGCCQIEHLVCYDVAGDSIRVSPRVARVVKPIVLEECRNGTPDASNDPSVVRCLPCDFNCPE